MNVTLNARFLTQPLSGVQRYAQELVSALDRLLAEDAALRERIGPVRACSPRAPVRDPGWQHIEVQLLPGGRGHLWEQTRLARAARRDILISLGNSGPITHPAQILTLHIWTMPQSYRPGYRRLHRVLRPLLARRAARLNTVSLHSAVELGSRMGLPVSRFAVIGNGADHIQRIKPDPKVLQRHGLQEGGYLLSIGNQSPNKNIAALIEAHQLAGPGIPPLVLAGGNVPGVAGVSLTYTGSPQENVIMLGRVSDRTLRSLYENAAGFVFPSLNEGFEIPPLEAMALGTPVLAARAGALPEILRDAAIYFDPCDIPDMAATLCRFHAMSPDSKKEMRRRGTARAAEFTWRASAEALIGQILSLQGAGAAAVPGLRQRDTTEWRRSA